MATVKNDGTGSAYRPGIAKELVGRYIAALEDRDWDALSAVLSPDVVYELPQTRERIHGRDRYLQFNREFPGDWHLTPVTVLGDDTDGALLFRWVLDGEDSLAIAFFGVVDGLIARVTDFWPEPYEPPPGRGHLTERWPPDGDGGPA